MQDPLTVPYDEFDLISRIMLTVDVKSGVSTTPLIL